MARSEVVSGNPVSEESFHPEKEIIVDVDSLSFAYRTGKNVLENVSLQIQTNEFASIVGPNGGGKSTLVRLILGLLKPDQGTIRLFGDDPEKTRRWVGYTPQSLNVDRFFPITVSDVVLTGRLGSRQDRKNSEKKESFFSRLFQRYTKEDFEAAQKAMDRLRIGNIARQTFSSLSGGQRQRVLLARALCCEPKLLILDEPANNMDPTSVEQLYPLLEELNREIAILIVSHDLGVVSQYVQSVICVNRQVVVHPTSEFDGRAICEIYGVDLKMIRHDHRCSEEGHHVTAPR